MSGFITDLNVTKIAEAGFGEQKAQKLIAQYPLAVSRIRSAQRAGRALWRYNEDLIFDSALVGRVICKAGDITDFSSVPRAPFAFWLAGDTAHASAGVHDELCNNWYPHAHISWRRAADVFREAMREEGVPAWRRALMHWAVVGADPANRVQTGVDA